MIKRLKHLALLALATCANPGSDIGPPLTQLYFPAGIQHVAVPGSTDGVLFVLNQNNDKRYGTSSVVGIRLDDLNLPALGSTNPDVVQEVVQIPHLGPLMPSGVTSLRAQQSAQVGPFGTELGISTVGPNQYRLYVPSRAEGNSLFQVAAAIDSDGVPDLTCIKGSPDAGRNCIDTGVSLTPRKFEGSTTGVPRAPAPYGVVAAPRTCTIDHDCCNEADADNACDRSCSAGACIGKDKLPYHDIYVTHQQYADSPLASGLNPYWFLVRLDSDDFNIADDGLNYIDIGTGAGNSVLVKGKYAYVTGRALTPAPNLLRLISRNRVLINTTFENTFRVGDSRSIALSSDGKKLFVVTRIPDMLMVISLDDSNPDVPILQLERAVPLPDAANQVVVIPRAGKGDLAVASCTSGSSVAIYDEDVGDLVSIVTGVGYQPFGLAADVRGNAARIFVSVFGDGRIAVIDIANLDRPHEARLIAHFGAQQLCTVRGSTSPGCQSTSAGASP